MALTFTKKHATPHSLVFSAVGTGAADTTTYLWADLATGTVAGPLREILARFGTATKYTTLNAGASKVRITRVVKDTDTRPAPVDAFALFDATGLNVESDGGEAASEVWFEIRLIHSAIQ